MYCTVEDIRAEGVTEDQASDEKLTGLITLAGNYIDRMTRQWFEPREKTVVLDGNGGVILPLPVFLIKLPESLTIDCEEATGYVLYNRFPPADDRSYPKMYRQSRWAKGVQNIVIKGLWGYVDEDGSGGYTTPSLIRRAVMKLALYNFPDLGDAEAQQEKAQRGALLSETTDGHSYSLSDRVLSAMSSSTFTGDSEIDQTISQFMMAPIRMAIV